MNLTLSLIGSSLRAVDSDSKGNDFDFPLAATIITYDEEGGAVELACNNRSLYFKPSEVSSPSLANLAAVRTQFNTWLGLAIASTGKLIKSTDSFTTAVGATAYSVGDVINPAGAAILESLNVGCNSGYLTGLCVEMDNTSPLTTPSPLPTLRIRFFDAADSSLNVADNAADEVAWNNSVRRLGHVDLPIMVADGNRLIAQDETIRFPFANLTGGLLYYKIINMTGTPTLGTASLGRGVFVRAKVDQN
jgi:hypothetical protein